MAESAAMPPDAEPYLDVQLSDGVQPDAMPALVVGYGSQLRGDDAAGRHAAAAIAAADLPGVAVLSLHQLVPEVAVQMVGRDVVVFVDADVAVRQVHVAAVETARPPSASRSSTRCQQSEGASGATRPLSHHCDPASLLQLTTLLGPAPAAVWSVSIPAVDLNIGAELSPSTSMAVEDAATRIGELLCASMPAGTVGPRAPGHRALSGT